MPSTATVLIVEDESDVRDVASGYVEALGYSVLAARDGDEALAIVKSDTPIDLMLTDIVMPGTLDGFALGRAAIAVRPQLKILHVTGYAEHLAAGRHGLDSGTVIAKPYRKEQLRLRIAGLLGDWAVERNVTLRRLYHYWLAKRGNLPWPDRRSIDPADLQDILPSLGIVEVLGGGDAMAAIRPAGSSTRRWSAPIAISSSGCCARSRRPAAASTPRVPFASSRAGSPPSASSCPSRSAAARSARSSSATRSTGRIARRSPSPSPSGHPTGPTPSSG